MMEKLGDKYCICCGNHINGFNKLPNEYLSNITRNGGCFPKYEMLNIMEYSCPVCSATDRDRATALYMYKEMDFDKYMCMLDIAPSEGLMTFVKRKFKLINYKTADLNMNWVDIKLDIMDMYQIQDESIDFFNCSHVLEHVIDDRKAISELYRILKPTGKGILIVPIELNRTETDEDPFCTDEGERWRRFGQYNHVRAYSKQEYISRIEECGFVVKQLGKDYFGERDMKKNALIDTSILYVVEKNSDG